MMNNPKISLFMGRDFSTFGNFVHFCSRDCMFVKDNCFVFLLKCCLEFSKVILEVLIICGCCIYSYLNKCGVDIEFLTVYALK